MRDRKRLLDLSAIPEDTDWTIGRTNGGLTIHARVGHVRRYADTPQEALNAAVLAYLEDGS